MFYKDKLEAIENNKEESFKLNNKNSTNKMIIKSKKNENSNDSKMKIIYNHSENELESQDIYNNDNKNKENDVESQNRNNSDNENKSNLEYIISFEESSDNDLISKRYKSKYINQCIIDGREVLSLKLQNLNSILLNYISINTYDKLLDISNIPFVLLKQDLKLEEHAFLLNYQYRLNKSHYMG
ncbi:hypothetical protein LY90DRAFT_508671 [Neocallimastix californiae]|uniref:Uncharacterized protein n=1 Tax=Neocallimastix californiae TaxID=1754190 RepID=A0A1Y2CQ92_9FUNG|nr:hypothetical protein LY90DRAFT_508671 [Neocallimastix californiae]|eukprot:ORY49200.1 hypothetical protein LY90DRAFT_508671 [Neocallimastix californiae]